MPSRVLYVGQEVKVQTNAGTGSANNVRYLPVQSASCEVTRPIEDILSFGRLGSLGRIQNAVSTCKADIKSYLPYQAVGTGNGATLDASFISKLTGDSLQGNNSTITVSPNGFTMSGILASMGVEITNGSFASADLSFVGIGEPSFSTAPTGSNFSEQTNMPASFSPVVSTQVSGQAISGCPSSFKFNLDIPNESLSCLGGVVTGSQGAVSSSYLQVGKPPFKATIVLEGTAIDAPSGSQLTNTYNIGKLGIQLPAGVVSSRSFNNAVGAVGATYNFTLEDVSAIFTDLT